MTYGKSFQTARAADHSANARPGVHHRLVVEHNLVVAIDPNCSLNPSTAMAGGLRDVVVFCNTKPPYDEAPVCFGLDLPSCFILLYILSDYTPFYDPKRPSSLRQVPGPLGAVQTEGTQSLTKPKSSDTQTEAWVLRS